MSIFATLTGSRKSVKLTAVALLILPPLITWNYVVKPLNTAATERHQASVQALEESNQARQRLALLQEYEKNQSEMNSLKQELELTLPATADSFGLTELILTSVGPQSRVTQLSLGLPQAEQLSGATSTSSATNSTNGVPGTPETPGGVEATEDANTSEASFGEPPEQVAATPVAQLSVSSISINLGVSGPLPEISQAIAALTGSGRIITIENMQLSRVGENEHSLKVTGKAWFATPASL